MNLVIWAVLATVAGQASEIQIQDRQGVVEVKAAGASWSLSRTVFDVVHAASFRGTPRLGPGRVSVSALGQPVTFGKPLEVTRGRDWVELRGWADAPKNLWYVAHYQFFAEHPFARLVLTLTDRHDTSPAEEPWDAHWKNRFLSAFRLEIGEPGGKPFSVTQHNSYSFSSPGAPWVEDVDVSGSPYQWTQPETPLDPKRFQLVHGAKDGANQIVWHPMFEGRAALAALLTPFSGASAYHAAKATVYEVVDAAGKTHDVVGDQQGTRISLGTYALGKASVVRLKATGGGEEIAIAGPLELTPEGGAPRREIEIGGRHDGTLVSGPTTLVVKDFWQHHPISLWRTENAFGWQAIERPEEYTGGMGLTIESMISLDGPSALVAKTLYQPPARSLPPQVHPSDGSLARGPVPDRYDALVRRFAAIFSAEMERTDGFGWRNWGDYQIGSSYADPKTGVPIEEWANLQYDLPYGLLLGWMRTGDPALWRLAQASVRHLMDIDLVKFSPFSEKMNGLVYRKGEMPRSRSHIDAEPIVDQGFAWRSLLLYSHLTGESWAKDLAKQNIDRLVYFGATHPRYVLDGGRPTAWMLRAALAGAEWFPDDRTHAYQATADEIVRLLVGYYKEHKRLPGRQPVWQGQMVEGLAEYHRRTHRADVAEVIVGEMRHLLTDGLQRRSDGGWDFRYCYDDSSDCPKWTSEENYAFLWLGAIGYARDLSHDPFFARWGDTLFAYGEAKLAGRHDIRSWTSLLGFPFLYLEGSASR